MSVLRTSGGAVLLASGVLVLAGGGLALWATGGDRLDPGSIPATQILTPLADEAKGSVFLLSGANGWGDGERATAQSLRQAGAVVVGIDTPLWLEELRAEDESAPGDPDCAYLVSDIESINQQVQRRLGNADYFLPTVAGAGLGGALALAIAAQTPDSTIGATLALDPDGGIPLARPLCTDAASRSAGALTIYDLTPGPLPDPIQVLLTPDAPAEGRAHVAALKKNWPDIAVDDIERGEANAILARRLAPSGAPSKAGPLSGLPLATLAAPARQNAMAIVLSGDGGWRDLDKTIAERFQAEGLPTVGLDSLRYFWNTRSPEEIAHTLSAIMDAYTARWNVSNVALVGYSFGADVLPAALAAMDESHRAQIAQVSLLGFAPTASFQVSVSGWLGLSDEDAAPTLPPLETFDLKRVQCFFGREEGEDTACPALEAKGVEVVETEGGHHFDGNYDRLADIIMTGLAKRTGAPAPGGTAAR